MSHIPTDPVCGMTVDPEHAAGTSVFEGETYYFCSQSCLERFRANPRQYLGSHSTSAMSQHTPAPAVSGPSNIPVRCIRRSVS